MASVDIRENDKQLYSVDLLKFICAILIIVVHTQPFINYFYLDKVSGVITRFPVPIFFAISSYFFFIKPLNNKMFFEYEKRLFILYFLWTLIYVPFTYSKIFLESASTFLLSTFNILFKGIVTEFWFFPNLMLGMAFVYFFTKYFSDRILIIFSLLSILISLMFNTYYVIFLNNPIFNWIHINVIPPGIAYRSILYSFPYCALVALLAKNTEFKKSSKLLRKNLLLSILFVFLLICEGFFTIFVFHVQSTGLFFFVFPAVIYMLNLSMQIKLPKSDIYIHLRKLSILFYVTHPLFIVIINKYLHRTNGIIFFVEVLLCASITSIVIYVISLKFKSLKYLY